MDDLFTSPPPRRWPWIIAGVASLLWAAGIVAAAGPVVFPLVQRQA